MVNLKYKANVLHLLSQSKAPQEIRQNLVSLAGRIGVEHFRKRAAEQLIAETQPDRVIPDQYRPYRALVRDGIEFFLSHISFERLLDVLVHQLQMDQNCAVEERLLELAKQFPTLHKLGQIIARNQHIAPCVKQWLIHLENGRYGTVAEDLLSQINNRLESVDRSKTVQIEPYILAEASVGAVIPFKWRACKDQDDVLGVFKVLKPRIKEKLDEELAIFDEIAAYFEFHRHRYELKDFKFKEFFKDVRDTLRKEINLIDEQSHLNEAARFFGDSDEIVIPDLIPLCDETMTAMAYIEGDKITEAELTRDQRRACANNLSASLICRPLFATEASVLFHGDPHAGNIMVSEKGESRHVKIVLLDWSLAGHLSQNVRVKIVRLIKSVILDDADQICDCIDVMAKKTSEKRVLSKSGMSSIVNRITRSGEYANYSLLKKSFWLLEQLSYEGVVFPPDLMLFRKAIFTLEGVLHDLDSQFNLDTFLFKYMANLLAQEMPKRFGNVFFFQSDHPENYQSLLSNNDLQALMLQQYTATIKHNTQATVDFFDRQNQFMRSFFN